MRKLPIALALLLGVVFILTRFAELHNILAVFQRGKLVYLGLALLAQAAWIYNLSAFYQSVYQALGIREKRLYMAKLVTAANFMSVVAPSGGLSALAVFLSEARRCGRSTAKVTVAAMLYIWFEYLGTLFIVMLGLAELARRNRLHWAEIAAALILLVIALVIGLLFYLGLRSTRALGKALAWMIHAVNTMLQPFLRRSYLQETQAYTFSGEIAEGIAALRNNPRWAARPALFTLYNKCLLLVVLLFSFLAFEVPCDAGTLVAGLSVAHLFVIVSPTPAGIGIVEGVLVVALKSLDVSLSDATVITLSYRGFSFWLPLLIGMVAIRLLNPTRRPSLPHKHGETAMATPDMIGAAVAIPTSPRRQD